MALWLISHRHLIDSLSVVRLNDCNIDASYLLPSADGDVFDGPIIQMLKSTSLRRVPKESMASSQQSIVRLLFTPSSTSVRVLDLKNNPLFILLKSGAFVDGSVDGADSIPNQIWRLEQSASANFALALRLNESVSELCLGETSMGVFTLLEILRALRSVVGAAVEVVGALCEGISVVSSLLDPLPSVSFALFPDSENDVDSELSPNHTLELLDISHNHILKVWPTMFKTGQNGGREGS